MNRFGAREGQENADADRGKPTFSEDGCATCHGPSGRGANGPSLLPMERDFPDFGRVVREGIGRISRGGLSQRITAGIRRRSLAGTADKSNQLTLLSCYSTSGMFAAKSKLMRARILFSI